MYLLYMNGNMKRLFLFFLLGFSVLSIAYSQSKDNLYKTIPVVRYIPDAFLPAIDGSFIHSIESLNIYIQDKDTLYVQYRFGKLRDYDSEFFTVNHINTKPFFLLIVYLSFLSGMRLLAGHICLYIEFMV